MTDNKMADIPQEGEITFPKGNEEDTSSDSPAENNTTDEDENDEGDAGDDTESGAGASKTGDDDVPFDKHPRWREREKEWDVRYSDQEKRHQDDIKALRVEFGEARKENAENTEIPPWFGGTQEQWNQYLQWNDKQIKSAEERAIKRISETNSAQEKAVTDATEYMQSEITFLQDDKILNPEGKKVDPNKLLAIVMDTVNGGKYPLLDSQGRWNYRAGWRLMNSQSAKPLPTAGDRKQIAGATTSSKSTGETKPKSFKTSDDFKANRPW